MSEISRIKVGSDLPGTLVVSSSAVGVPISRDNLVCLHCGQPVGEKPWLIVSSPKLKGLMAVACEECSREVMNLLGSAIRAIALTDS